MDVPNMLFYENMIKCGYKSNIEKQFMYSKAPFLFIDVPDGQEEKKGTSYYNTAEAEVIKEFTDFCLGMFNQSLQIGEQNENVPIMKFTKNSIYVITPYNA